MSIHDEESRATRRGQIVELQRARILDAMAEIVADCGLRGTTVVAVTKHAFVSPITFLALFGSIEQCFVALVEQVTARSTELVRDAFERESAWCMGALAGLEVLLAFFDAEPALARVCLIEALAGPPAALERRASLLESLVPLIEGGREQLPANKQPPSSTEEATIASVAGILHARLVAGRAPPFIGLLGELVALVVAPYRGPAEAAEAARTGNERSQTVALEHLTRPPALRVQIPKQLLHAKAHRARSCLSYLSENPGASNKEVATGIDVPNLGQVSVLLLGLHDLCLLTKHAGAAGRPNAWWLSAEGEQVLRSLKRR